MHPVAENARGHVNLGGIRAGSEGAEGLDAHWIIRRTGQLCGGIPWHRWRPARPAKSGAWRSLDPAREGMEATLRSGDKSEVERR